MDINQKELINELEYIKDMISNFSHELSNSLGICVTLVDYMDSKNYNFWDALESNQVDEKTFLEYVEEVKDNTHTLKNNLDLANNLLDNFSDFRKNLKVEEPQEIYLLEFIKKNLLNLKGVIIPSKYELHLDIDQDIKLKIQKNYLLQIFLNLIKNAIIHGFKNQKNGKILISTSLDEEYIYISVKDNGVGIKQEHKDKIFEEFYTTSKKGTGLGLNITRTLVRDKLKGELSVESSYGEYTEFIIQIPLLSKGGLHE